MLANLGSIDRRFAFCASIGRALGSCRRGPLKILLIFIDAHIQSGFKPVGYRVKCLMRHLM